MLSLTSPTFLDGRAVPVRHRGPGHGANRSPELTWRGAPEQTAGYALRMVDPAAPDFRHWLAIFPAGTTHLAEGADASYVGPCPPSGEHRYEVTVQALDTLPTVPDGFDLAELDAAVAGHVLGSASLVGTYRPGPLVAMRRRAGSLRARLARRLRRG